MEVYSSSVPPDPLPLNRLEVIQVPEERLLPIEREPLKKLPLTILWVEVRSASVQVTKSISHSLSSQAQGTPEAPRVPVAPKQAHHRHGYHLTLNSCY